MTLSDSEGHFRYGKPFYFQHPENTLHVSYDVLTDKQKIA